MNNFNAEMNLKNYLMRFISTIIPILGLVVICFAALKGHTQNTEETDSPNTHAELLSKLEQIVDLRRQQTEIAKSNFNSGRLSIDAFGQVVIKEQKAKIKLAKYEGDTQNHTKALESIIQYRKHYLNRLQNRQKAGVATSVDVMNAEVQLLKSECALLELNQ